MRKCINILAAALMIAGIGCLTAALKEQKPYKEAEIELEILKKTVVAPAAQKEDPLARSIDFRALKQINEDIAAWIYIPGTAIDYPVVIGENDSEYLKKSFRGGRSSLGAIFGFSDMERDFSDAHICLFGHNMRSPQMFGELKRYQEPEFADTHRKLYCYTPEGVTEYRLFSAYECDKRDQTFEHRMQMNSSEYRKLSEHIQCKNTVETAGGVILEDDFGNSGRQIVTLSCCSEYKRTVNRMTVHFLETGFSKKL